MKTYTDVEILNSHYTNYVQIPSPQLHNHTFWEILIVLNGNCKHTVNDKTSVIATGDVIFLRPLKDKHFFEDSTSETYRHRDIYVTDTDMKTWCDIVSPNIYKELLTPATPISFSVSSSMLKYIEETTVSTNFQDSAQSSLLKNIHLTLTIGLITAYLIKQVPNSIPPWLEAFVNELKNPNNFSESVEDLIAKCHYSHGYVCREFKKYMNQTVVSFFYSQKINHASFLLMNTDLKIIDVSNAVGYTSPKNFIQHFTKIFSMSPSVWRQKNQLLPRK